MTRTLIVFGQGALRAHPYAYAQVKAVESNDLKAFDEAFMGHIGHVIRNMCRSVILSCTRGYAASSFDTLPELKIYFRRLKWASASFGIMADIAMAALGGQLKMKEKITGRFADILAQMYIATSILRRFEAEGRPKEDLPLVHYSLKHCFAVIQASFDGIFDNLKVPGLRWLFKGWLGAWSRINSMGSQASDGFSHAISTLMLKQGEARERLTQGIYIPEDRQQQMGRLEHAFRLVNQVEEIDRRVYKARKDGILPRIKGRALYEEALRQKLISEADFKLFTEVEAVRYDAILVDDFSQEEYLA
jgi:acyl-CoA dehydrogenase